MRTFILAMIGMTLCQSLWAAPQLIERVVPSRSPVVVPYSKYRLDNGMTVIINENHRDPIVHVEMMFHVGSAREDIGKSGFAHLFEHMMFQGSKHVPYNAHFQIVTDAGGRMNGSASRDWTTYHETLPRNELETALWLESDRMGYFIDGINQEKFEIQRATVKNEKAQNYDNRPYGLTGAYIDRLLYPVNHPYSWQTIGNVDDLDRVNAEDLKRFFQRWYGPNNATLVIAGDVKTDDALTLVDRYFGPILPGPSVRNTPRKVSTMDAIIYASYEDSLIQQPQLIRAYPAPYRHHYDEAELDAAAFVLGTGANSLLYQALVKTQLASEVDVSNYASELSGEFVISAIPYPGVSLGQLDAAITQCIDSIARDGLAKRQVDQFITRYQVDTMRLLEQLDQTAHQLALNEIIDGHPGFLAKEAARYQLVTTESVRQAVNTYITHRPYVALSVMPKGKLSDRLAPDSPTKSNSATHSVAIRSDIDRSLRPTSNITGYSLNLPIWNTRVNDIPVLGISDTSNELVRITYSIPGGKILASQLGVHNGTAGVLSRLWNQDTAQRSLEDFTSELDRLGASISVEVGLDDTVLSIVALKSNMVPVMTLAAERWFTPRLSDSDFNRVRGELIEVVTSRLSNLDWIADFASVQESYGRSHPMGQSDLGTVPEINAVTLAAVRDLWGQLIRCHRPNISVVGDATEDDIQRWMSEFPVTASVTVPIDFSVNPPIPTQSRVLVIHVPGATQAELRCVFPGPRYSATGDFYIGQLFNFSVGGNFNSRLNMQLREVRGVSYGAYSMFQPTQFPGYFEMGASVKADGIRTAVEDTLTILSDFRQVGVSEKEMVLMKNCVRQRDALRYAAPQDKLDLLGRIQSFNLDTDFLNTRANIASTITLDELNTVGKRLFNWPVTVIVVGDADRLVPTLSELGYPLSVIPATDYISRSVSP